MRRGGRWLPCPTREQAGIAPLPKRFLLPDLDFEPGLGGDRVGFAGEGFRGDGLGGFVDEVAGAVHLGGEPQPPLHLAPGFRRAPLRGSGPGPPARAGSPGSLK